MSDIIKTINNMQIQDTSDPDIQILTIDTTKDTQDYINLNEAIEGHTTMPTSVPSYPTSITGYLLLKEIVPSLDYLYVKTTKVSSKSTTYDFSKTYKEDYKPISFSSQDIDDPNGIGFGIIKLSDINKYAEIMNKYGDNPSNMSEEDEAIRKVLFGKLFYFFPYNIKHIDLTPFNRYKEGFIWDVSTSKDYEESDITNTPEAYINAEQGITLTNSDEGISAYNLSNIYESNYCDSHISTSNLLQIVNMENDYLTFSPYLKGTASFYLAKNLSGYIKLQSLMNEYKVANDILTDTSFDS